MTDTTKAREIRGQMAAIVGPADERSTARELARSLAADAQVGWSRMLSWPDDSPLSPAETNLMLAQFAAAHALEALRARDEVVADEVAEQITCAWFYPPGVGEWIWEHLGDDAQAVADLARELAAVTPATDAEVVSLRSGAQSLGKTVVHMSRSMRAAQIEMAQNGPAAGMQWILNSLPDVDDNPEDQHWDGKESATEWLDRTAEVSGE